jgi:hypothetical protein
LLLASEVIVKVVDDTFGDVYGAGTVSHTVGEAVITVVRDPVSKVIGVAVGGIVCELLQQIATQIAISS